MPRPHYTEPVFTVRVRPRPAPELVGYRIRMRHQIHHEETLRRGFCPCFVCGKPVLKAEATLEHIIPLSQGGTDARWNLTISHGACNHRRGNR